jgi:hypothetical protein
MNTPDQRLDEVRLTFERERARFRRKRLIIFLVSAGGVIAVLFLGPSATLSRAIWAVAFLLALVGVATGVGDRRDTTANIAVTIGTAAMAGSYWLTGGTMQSALLMIALSAFVVACATLPGLFGRSRG